MRKLLFLLILTSCSPAGRQEIGYDFYKKQVEIAAQNLPKKTILPKYIIKDKESAMKIAEAIVVSVYDKESIERQKPFEAYQIKDYWIVGGLPNNWKGGTFQIILDAQTAEIVGLTHSK